MIRHYRQLGPLFVVLAFVLALSVPAALAQDATATPQGQTGQQQEPWGDYYVVLNNIENQPVALITFVEEQDFGTVALLVQARNLAPGWHTVTVTTGDACDSANNFETAGDAYNPTNAAYPNRGGDLIPLYAMQDGTAAMSYRTDQFSVSEIQDNMQSMRIVMAEGFGDNGNQGRVACGAMSQGAAPSDAFVENGTSGDDQNTSDQSDTSVTEELDEAAQDLESTSQPGDQSNATDMPGSADMTDDPDDVADDATATP
jgi:Cu/Zn superoxide dismutase